MIAYYQKHKEINHYLFVVDRQAEMERLRVSPLTSPIRRMTPRENLKAIAILEFDNEPPTPDFPMILSNQFPKGDPPWTAQDRVRVVINQGGYELIQSRRRLDERIMNGRRVLTTINIQQGDPANFP